MNPWLLLSCLLPFLGAGELRHPGCRLPSLHSRGSEEGTEETALQESIKRIRHLNSLSSGVNATAVYGINKFSHLSPEEFRATYLQSRLFKVPKYVPGASLEGTETPLPAKFDWRDKNVVTGVRNQEATRVKLVKDAEYSFKAETGMCHYFSRSDFGVSITGYTSYDLSGHEDEMMKMLVKYGPLPVIVDAISWQDYLGGIIQYHCSSGEANHAVIVTGYDTTGSIPYWIVRNSWGTSWGIDGYVRIKIGSNMCGIADEVSAVFV